MSLQDPYHIIPRGVAIAAVRPFDLQVRTVIEYDIDYLQDRVRSDVFINGVPTGVYGTAVVEDRFLTYGPGGLRAAMDHYGPELERIIVDEFMGLKYRHRVNALEVELEALKAHVKRARWWHIRRHLTTLRERIKA